MMFPGFRIIKIGPRVLPLRVYSPALHIVAKLTITLREQHSSNAPSDIPSNWKMTSRKALKKIMKGFEEENVLLSDTGTVDTVKRRRKTMAYTMDDQTASDLVQILKKKAKLDFSKTVFIDNNAASGALSLELLKAGANQVCAFTASRNFREELQENCPNELLSRLKTSEQIVDEDGASLYEREHGLPVNLVEELQPVIKPWEEESNIAIVALDIMRPSTIIDVILHGIYRRSNIFTLGRATVYLVTWESVGALSASFQRSATIYETRQKTDGGVERYFARWLRQPEAQMLRLILLASFRTIGKISLTGIHLPHARLKTSVTPNLKTGKLSVVEIKPLPDPLLDGDTSREALRTVAQVLFLIESFLSRDLNEHALPYFEHLLTDGSIAMAKLGYHPTVHLTELSLNDLVKITKALQKLPAFEMCVLHSLEKPFLSNARAAGDDLFV